jgi:hypothetical protein
MKPSIVVAIILSVTAIIITGMNLYFSPFWACTRDNSDAGWCARAVGSQIPFPHT